MQLRSSIIALAFAMALCSSQAWAGELRKCVMPGGSHVYVDGACPGGSRVAWQRDTAPEATDAVSIRRRMDELERWQVAVRNEVAAQLAPPRGRVQPAGLRNASLASNRCERERARRARIRDQEWMKMTYDRMVQLDQDVSAACR